MKLRINKQALKDARKILKLSRENVALRLAALGLDTSTSAVIQWETKEDFIPRSLAIFVGLCEVLELCPDEIIIAEEEDGKPALLSHFPGAFAAGSDKADN